MWNKQEPDEWIRMSESISEYLTNPSDLPVNGVVVGVGARRPLVARHVHTHDVQMLR